MLFDLADIYGGGRCEELLGQFKIVLTYEKRCDPVQMYIRIEEFLPILIFQKIIF